MFPIIFISSRRRHTRLRGDWSSDVCSSDLLEQRVLARVLLDEKSRLEQLAIAVLGDAIVLEHLIGDRSEERRVGKDDAASWQPLHAKHTRVGVKIELEAKTKGTYLQKIHRS